MSTITVSLIQTTLHWEDKAANRQHIEEKIATLTGKTQVVLLPEMFTTGFSMNPSQLAEKMEGESVQWLRSMAVQYRLILAGSLIVEEDGKYFNRLIWMLPTGLFGYYDKRHLFAFAGEDKQYTAGNKRLVTAVNGWRFNLQICYDLRFPVWARQQVSNGEPEYDVLVYVANWPEKRRQAWITLLQARAIENQCYVIGVNRIGEDGKGVYHSGDSMVIDPLGEILFAQKDQEAIHSITLNKERLIELRQALPFLKDGDKFGLFPG
ncbi:MAG: amidohydrolase [Bacteroidetes bacterium]|nr:amidohydrolase [Bacteroidota bacterium]